MVGYRSIPQWLDALLKEEFFDPCLRHGDRTPEKNLYCIDCSSSVCQLCLFLHRKHVLLQVRRYVYHDVLKLSDAQRLMDCSGVQAYIANSKKVVFLKQRPLNRRVYKGALSSCLTCNRNLQDPFIFCCLSCKVKHIVTTRGSLKINLSQHSMLGFSDLDEYQVTPDSVLDSPGSVPTSSGSTGTSDLWTTLQCTAASEVVRKKRSNLSAHRGLNRASVLPQPAAPYAGLFDSPPADAHLISAPICADEPTETLDRVCVCSLPARPREVRVSVSYEPVDTHMNRRKRVPNRSPLC